MYIYIMYIFIRAVHCMSTVHKSAQHYYRAFISINGRRIHYKYIIATNSFMYFTAIFRLYNMEETCLTLHIYDRQ